MNRFKIRVYPDGIEQYVEEGITIMKALEELGVELETLCGGAGWCGQCKVKVSGNITSPTSNEVRLLGEDKIRDGFRLACQTRILGNVDVDVPEETRMYVHRILTSGVTMERARLNPAVRRFNVNLPGPSLEDQRPDLERIEDSVGIEISSVKTDILKSLPKVLRENNFNIEAIIYNSELVEVRGLKNRHLLGIAVDIGTTTVVAYLLDLEGGNVLDIASTMNPQAKRGADVISRIDYASKGGLEELSSLIRGEINSLIYELCNKNSIETQDIYDMTIVGNTTMMHLFLGVLPEYIAISPYIPVFSRSLLVDAKELGIDINPNGKCYLLPNISSYVGADTIGVVLSTGIYKGDGIKLALDIGTNGEMVLKDNDRLFACSTAAGPAFEGANITYGMRGARGAIDHISIDDGELKIHIIDDVPPIGICGSGLLDAVAVMLDLGILDETGRILEPQGELFKNLIRNGPNGKEFVLRAYGKEIPINQKDIRELQLAKGAIRAGIEILLEEAGRGIEDIDTVYLAGAFGTFLSPESAIKIGLLPPLPLERVRSIGNAAGEGAKLTLIDKEYREIAESAAKEVYYIELSSRKDFQDKFMDAMYFEFAK